VVSFWLISAGIIGGLLAALFGLVDWLSIPNGTRAKSVGLTHGIGNVIVTGLFAISWYLRLNTIDYVPATLALLFSFAGVILALFTGWLGGEMVYRLGMAVDRGANLDAPSSLSDQPAGVTRPSTGQRVQPGVLPLTGRPPDDDDDINRP
jgi:uncharacterized membrane protein